MSKFPDQSATAADNFGTAGSTSLNIARRALAFLALRERRRWWLLVPLGVVIAALEVLGAIMVFDLIDLIGAQVAPDELRLSGLLDDTEAAGGRVAILLCLTLALLYGGKNGLRLFEAAYRHRLGNRAVSEVSSKLLRAYLEAPYALHLQRNSAELIRNVSTSVDFMCLTVMTSIFAALTEGLVLCGVLAVLIHALPLAALVALAGLAVILALIIRWTQRRHDVWGQQLQDLLAAAQRLLQEGFRGIREVKAFDTAPSVAHAFLENKRRTERIRVGLSVLEPFPPLVMETLFIIGIALVIALSVMAGAGMPVVLADLGVFCFAVLRLLPAANRLVHHINNLHLGAAAVRELSADWWDLVPQTSDDVEPMPETAAAWRDIQFRDVAYRYPNASHDVLSGLNLTIQAGESIGVVGPSGAGKTTLIDLLLALIEPTAGSLQVDGQPLTANRRQWRRGIGYVPQDIILLDDSLRANILLGAEEHAERLQHAIRDAQLDAFIAHRPEGNDTLVGENGVALSGGERQRVALARALYRQPRLLLLDEATSALDATTEASLIAALSALPGDMTKVVVSHRSAAVAGCDKVLTMSGNGGIDVVSASGARSPQSPEHGA